MVLAHGLLVRFRESFDRVFEALNRVEEASNVYIEALETRPRTALAVGEKYFFRAKNYLTVTVMLIEDGESTAVKVIASGGREGLLDLFDMGSYRDYAHLVVDEISRNLGKRYEILSEVDYLEKSKSSLLYKTERSKP